MLNRPVKWSFFSFGTQIDKIYSVPSTYLGTTFYRTTELAEYFFIFIISYSNHYYSYVIYTKMPFFSSHDLDIRTVRDIVLVLVDMLKHAYLCFFLDTKNSAPGYPSKFIEYLKFSSFGPLRISHIPTYILLYKLQWEVNLKFLSLATIM